jgi:hypothetical protein
MFNLAPALRSPSVIFHSSASFALGMNTSQARR